MDKIVAQIRHFTHPPRILHLHLTFPLWPKKIDECLKALDNFKPQQSNSVFVSLNGIEQKPQNCQILHDAIKHKKQVQKVPVYSFLEDRISGLTYYIASPSSKIYANPFCMMGDLTVPHKRYTNVVKLMDFLGVKVQKLGTAETKLWQKYYEPHERQGQLTQKWLQVVENNLKQSLKATRNIEDSAVEEFGTKLISPNKALQLKLIDSISTVNQVKSAEFSKHKMNEIVINGLTRNPTFNQSEVQVLQRLAEYVAMPKTVLMSMEDPLPQHISQFLMVFGQRLQDPQKLQQLDILLGSLFTHFQHKLSNMHTQII